MPETRRPEVRRQRSRGPDDQHRAWRVVGDLVGNRAQQEALGAGHALVADDDEVTALLLGHVDDRVGGVALTREGLDLRDAALARELQRSLEHGQHVLSRADQPLRIARRSPALLTQAQLRYGFV